MDFIESVTEQTFNS